MQIKDQSNTISPIYQWFKKIRMPNYANQYGDMINW